MRGLVQIIIVLVCAIMCVFFFTIYFVYDFHNYNNNEKISWNGSPVCFCVFYVRQFDFIAFIGILGGRY